MATLIIAIGAYFLGAVYLGGTIAIGLTWGSGIAVKAALFSAGLGYLTQAGQVMNLGEKYTIGLWAASVVTGVSAGLLLLVGG